MTASLNSAERRGTPAASAERRRAIFSPPSDRESAFRSAQRRSSRVRFLRKAILACALGSVAAMILIAIYNPFSTKLGALSFSDVGLDGTKIAMARPKLAGFRSDGQPYTLTAEKALQDIKQPTIVELEKLSGEIGMTGGETTRLSADAGTYDSVAERMKLTSNVRIGSARFEVRLRSADIDFKTGVYQSDEPVEVHVGERTTITGDSATARHNGQEFVFEGHVRTTIIPSTAAAEADAKGTSP
jgi:lipopolysaccharide export system protein LptC